ncbi:uncharacterized protein L969DRAFT_50781 [Mixia osmundae IAM 14324]|uniref:N-acetyltransferase domain-containing protein n=1 Tax=Mixia osmundae (strain CBS 9802 / IAM 14324 / JCM 22182 / KY 12970) TaxID=764103 RepID=G7E827_MIXOS|nr:uncharacterized protein L969DRAFT_50781 [Mixia osmundae IAM 14324]KEI38588.1 hypothetical protein L969DRAFT_50781 [Mixia osmundae IAM 14324]GAA98987.1 hypothetical protein E5Q_05676 [Mixia osmundae IAM 14324]
MASEDLAAGPLEETAPLRAASQAEDDYYLAPMTELDLDAWCKLQWQGFPALYDWLEPKEGRPDDVTRLRRGSKRCLAMLRRPHTICTKAVERSSGALVGIAVWAEPGGRLEAPFNYKTVGEDPESWQGVNIAAHKNLFDGYDRERREILKDQPHWYLGPIVVDEAHQRRGIASLLLKQGTDLADSSDPPLPHYLEATEAGCPVYQKLGWELAARRKMGHIMIRPARGRTLARTLDGWIDTAPPDDGKPFFA